MKNIRLVLVTLLMCINQTLLFAQATNPTPQSLPYSQNFSSVAHTSTSYPAGWQGWVIGTTSSTSFRTTAPTANVALAASSTAATTTGGVQNYNGKLGLLSSSSTDVALCLALNTTGFYRAVISASGTSTIRNPHDGSANTRINEFTLQYRVGTSGSFTTLFTVYSNNTTNQTTAVTTPQNNQLKNYLLPTDADNQPVVQVRWVQRDNNGSYNPTKQSIDRKSVV